MDKTDAGYVKENGTWEASPLDIVYLEPTFGRRYESRLLLFDKYNQEIITA